MLSALFSLCTSRRLRQIRGRLPKNSGQGTCEPEIDLPQGEEISQKGDNTYCEIGQENSKQHPKRYSNARFPRVARQPTRQHQGKNGEQRQQCKFCERCAELQDNSLPIDRLFATAAFLEKSDETVGTGRSGTAPSKPSPI
jgi:hypothetical protein